MSPRRHPAAVDISPSAHPAMTCRLFLAFVGFALASASPAREIEFHDLPLLLADDSAIAARSGAVRTIHPARTRSVPVIVSDHPWETGRVYLYGSVLRDDRT